jgi:hypothetical protein
MCRAVDGGGVGVLPHMVVCVCVLAGGRGAGRATACACRIVWSCCSSCRGRCSRGGAPRLRRVCSGGARACPTAATVQRTSRSSVAPPRGRAAWGCPGPQAHPVRRCPRCGLHLHLSHLHLSPFRDDRSGMCAWAHCVCVSGPFRVGAVLLGAPTRSRLRCAIGAFQACKCKPRGKNACAWVHHHNKAAPAWASQPHPSAKQKILRHVSKPGRASRGSAGATHTPVRLRRRLMVGLSPPTLAETAWATEPRGPGAHHVRGSCQRWRARLLLRCSALTTRSTTAPVAPMAAARPAATACMRRHGPAHTRHGTERRAAVPALGRQHACILP